MDTFTIITPPVWLTGMIRSEQDEIAAQFCINDTELLRRLEGDKGSIEEYFGGKLDWSLIHNAKRIGIDKKEANLQDTSHHPGLYEWLSQNLEKLEKVFMWKLASYYIDDNRI